MRQHKMGASKNGIFFSLDAIIALTIMTVGLLLIANTYIAERQVGGQTHTSEDVAAVLGELRIDEVDNPLVSELIASGDIKGKALSNTILEQATQFWAEGHPDIATALIQNITKQQFPDLKDFNVVISDDVLYEEETSSKTLVIPMKRIVTGIAKEEVTRGTVARAFLTTILSKSTSQFLYFGGFVGQGNLTHHLDTLPADANVTAMEMELDAGGDFSLRINGQQCGGTYAPGDRNLTADRWDITGCNDSLQPGLGTKNNFTIGFLAPLNESYVGGGFIKITYLTQTLVEQAPSNSARYRFPIIEGMVNFFSGLMVPGTLTSMSGYLHYFVDAPPTSNVSAQMLISNAAVYNMPNASQDESVYLTNDTLASLLDYAALSNTTAPLRFFVGNISRTEIIVQINGTVHAALTTDVSGSMGSRMSGWGTAYYRDCDDPALNNSDTKRISVARCVDKEFVGAILNDTSTGNMAGLVSYDTSTDEVINLTNDKNYLGSRIDLYQPGGMTCISCGVYDSTKLLTDSFVQLNPDAWLYTIDYLSGDPPSGWEGLGFDDSSWQSGSVPDSFAGKYSLYPEFWELGDDAPLPVDFTSGLNSTENTYGLGTVTAQQLENPQFLEPNLENWTVRGSVNISSVGGAGVVMFEENFESGTLSKWTESGDMDWKIWSGSSAYRMGTRSGYADDSDNPSYITVNPAIGLSGQGDCTLNFWWYLYSLESGEYAALDIYDGTWHNDVWYGTDGKEYNWYKQSIDLDASYSMVNDFRIRYKFRANTIYDRVHIDNINITCTNPDVEFGLSDYWYVDSDHSPFGSVRQSFTPAGLPLSATLSVTHSTNDAYFDGTAEVFCNLTHPGGTTQVWNESWTGATNPAGAEAEEINLTGYVTSSTFDYTLECGAAVTSGGGRTVVAFDNIRVIIEASGDDGWDWQKGVFGNPTNNHVLFGDPSGKADYASQGRIEVKLGGNATSMSTESGAWGLQFYVTQGMVANITAGGSATLSFHYTTDDLDNDLEEGVWIKARLTTPNETVWLGSNLESYDPTPEIWAETGYHPSGFNEVTAAPYSEEITSRITEAGWYYLELGGKVQGTNSYYEGFLAAFDNIQIRIRMGGETASGNVYLRNKFLIDDVNNYHNPRLFISSQDDSEVYLNGRLVYTDNTGPHTPTYWNVLNGTIAEERFRNGENVLAVKLASGNVSNIIFDLEVEADTADAVKAILIMSDGGANYCHGPNDGEMDQNGQVGSCWSSNAVQETVDFACWAHQAYGINIYSVGFGPDASPDALQDSACCDNCSNFYQASDVSELFDIYKDIAQDILESSIEMGAQVLTPMGEVKSSTLYGDSYIDVTYKRESIDQSGMVSITQESGKFADCAPTVFINPDYYAVSEATVTSYSSEYWTDLLVVNGQVVYNLSQHGQDYSKLGDPFQLHIPPALLTEGDNSLILRTGESPLNATGCSKNNSLIYTALLNLSVPYGGVMPRADGCTWRIEFDDLSIISLAIPKDIAPPKNCSYISTNITYDVEDAYDLATAKLLDTLDHNDDGRVDVRFDKADLTIVAVTVEEVPSLFGPTIAEVRTWQ